MGIFQLRPGGHSAAREPNASCLGSGGISAYPCTGCLKSSYLTCLGFYFTHGQNRENDNTSLRRALCGFNEKHMKNH